MSTLPNDDLRRNQEPGGPEALVPTTRPLPQPKDGEILIKVAAAGVNRPDIAQRAVIRRRRAPRTCPVSKLPARWRLWAQV